ncbi:hypothetical protein SAMN05660745_00081 [Corynebacterium glucuronolyticum]|nr:hypothetical protein SAMN05660745_00081 [Corynebacterium glucuronolyticum]
MRFTKPAVVIPKFSTHQRTFWPNQEYCIGALHACLLDGIPHAQPSFSAFSHTFPALACAQTGAHTHGCYVLTEVTCVSAIAPWFQVAFLYNPRTTSGAKVPSREAQSK